MLDYLCFTTPYNFCLPCLFRLSFMTGRVNPFIVQETMKFLLNANSPSIMLDCGMIVG